ncbi:MAG: electron transfer flavoprotein subunit beta/FixA family protein [Flavobacteriales bacterium]|nr:electron transfer flavoprotein subunit beta/FixA family protein [Flavobacteriales bacterium]
MKILVCISKAPDTTSKISFADNNTRFNEAGVQFIVNPYDEWYALVRALEIKEALGGSVSIISVGSADYEPVIRKALAIGADDAVRVDAEETDSLFVAKQIAAYAKDKSFDAIFCGKETINYNGSVVPGMIAELLDLPYIALATKVDIANGAAIIEREIPGGKEVVEVIGPFVLSAAKGMAEQRIPNMRGIMAARAKPLSVISSTTDLPSTHVTSFSLPPAKGSCHYILPENAGELIGLLHNEAKAI